PPGYVRAPARLLTSVIGLVTATLVKACRATSAGAKRSPRRANGLSWAQRKPAPLKAAKALRKLCVIASPPNRRALYSSYCFRVRTDFADSSAGPFDPAPKSAFPENRYALRYRRESLSACLATRNPAFPHTTRCLRS